MTEPNLDGILIDLAVANIDGSYGYDEEAHDKATKAIKALIANQVREAKGDLIETICDTEATREAEGKDFISYKAFKRIKSLAGLDNG